MPLIGSSLHGLLSGASNCQQQQTFHRLCFVYTVWQGSYIKAHKSGCLPMPNSWSISQQSIAWPQLSHTLRFCST